MFIYLQVCCAILVSFFLFSFSFLCRLDRIGGYFKSVNHRLIIVVACVAVTRLASACHKAVRERGVGFVAYREAVLQ